VIDRLILDLSNLVPELRVHDAAPSDRAAIYFGAWFELEAVGDGKLARYRIVGPDETDATLGYISVDSPLARAVMKKRVDDEVAAELPGGVREFIVVAVSYEAPDLVE
jgi:transcription elongation factor GreB